MATNSIKITTTTTYTKLETLGDFTFDEFAEYTIQNIGSADVYLLEANTQPADNNANGNMLKTDDSWNYKVTKKYDLYVMGNAGTITVVQK